MTRKDGLLLGIITLIGGAFMLSYFSGFDPKFIMWSVIVTTLTIAVFLFIAYKKGLFTDPNKK